MKKFLKNNLIKKICILSFLIYVTVIFVNQQQTLASYHSQKEYYVSKIDEAKKHNEVLVTTKSNLESNEYIEQISREKLDMYSSNERVYINLNK